MQQGKIKHQIEESRRQREKEELATLVPPTSGPPASAPPDLTLDSIPDITPNSLPKITTGGTSNITPFPQQSPPVVDDRPDEKA